MKLHEIDPPTKEEMANASGVSRSAAENWPLYVKQCDRRASFVEKAIEEYGSRPITSDSRILDWGSALGGVALLLAERYRLTIHCADVDSHSLDWLSKHQPNVITHRLPLDPDLPFEDNAFDVIYGISVLTHLTPESQPAYLDELARICTPSGLVILTVASHWAVTQRQDKESRMPVPSPERLNAEGAVYYEYPDNMLQRMDFLQDKSYGQTYLSHEFVSKLVSRRFELLGIEEHALSQQDLIALTPLKSD